MTSCLRRSEWKYKLSDAATNVIGSGLYGEMTLSGTGLELEGKLILDKRIGKSLIAFNAVSEWEWAQKVKSTVVNDKVNHENKMELEDTQVEYDLAYMYNINPNLGIGSYGST